MKKLECPTHGIALTEKHGRNGLYYSCDFPGCTVVCWASSTSTPADKETRQARMKAHASFDPLWRYEGHNRSLLYQNLSMFLGIPKSQTHIGMFDSAQCARVLVFVKVVRAKGIGGSCKYE